MQYLVNKEAQRGHPNKNILSRSWPRVITRKKIRKKKEKKNIISWTQVRKKTRKTTFAARGYKLIAIRTPKSGLDPIKPSDILLR